jgi:hypothetical protein
LPGRLQKMFAWAFAKSLPEESLKKGLEELLSL